MAEGSARCRIPAGARRVAGSPHAAGAGGGLGAERRRRRRVIRIIAGEFRSRRLKTAATPKVRPTADRVREAWFAILQRSMRGARVLDLFAGSGALGPVGVSRGAHTAGFVAGPVLALAGLKAHIKT